MAERKKGSGQGLDFVAALEDGEGKAQQAKRNDQPAAGKEKKKYKHIGGYVEEQVLYQLKMIAVEERTSIIALLCEGINHVFEQRGKPPIAKAAR